MTILVAKVLVSVCPEYAAKDFSRRSRFKKIYFQGLFVGPLNTLLSSRDLYNSKFAFAWGQCMGSSPFVKLKYLTKNYKSLL
jgi:hypothetical protein